MKIPKQLQGKKAEKFEDECILILGVYDLIHWNRILLPLAEFYTQPFTPELIELFEGWDEDWEYSELGDRAVIGVIKNEGVYPQKDVVTYFRPKPKTLADFIACCNNSGIELIFKEN